jgi:hypothetical protein
MFGMSNQDLLDGILAACVLELLRDAKHRGRRITSDHGPLFWQESLAAVTSLEGEDLRGTITLLGPVSLFAQLCPLPPPDRRRDLQDFARELLNQVAGRFRNRLLAHGVPVAPSVPQSTHAETVRLSAGLRRGCSPIRIAVDDAVLETWLELAIRPGYRFPEHLADENGAVLKEGTMVFF